MLINANAAFNNGIVYYSGTGSLTFGNSASATVSNNNSFVNGLVTKTGASAFVFPTGDVTTRDLGNGSTTYNVLGALGINPDPVITSYSIHYTKLYDYFSSLYDEYLTFIANGDYDKSESLSAIINSNESYNFV